MRYVPLDSPESKLAELRLLAGRAIDDPARTLLLDLLGPTNVSRLRRHDRAIKLSRAAAQGHTMLLQNTIDGWLADPEPLTNIRHRCACVAI